MVDRTSATFGAKRYPGSVRVCIYGEEGDERLEDKVEGIIAQVFEDMNAVDSCQERGVFYLKKCLFYCE